MSPHSVSTIAPTVGAAIDRRTARLLLVDDNTHVTELFADALRERVGCQVVTASSPGEVTDEMVAAGGFDVAVVDLSFGFGVGGGTGVALLQRLHAAWPGTALVAASDGDSWVDELLLEAQVTMSLAGVLDKTAPVAEQVALLGTFVASRNMSA